MFFFLPLAVKALSLVEVLLFLAERRDVLLLLILSSLLKTAFPGFRPFFFFSIVKFSKNHLPPPPSKLPPIAVDGSLVNGVGYSSSSKVGCLRPPGLYLGPLFFFI